MAWKFAGRNDSSEGRPAATQPVLRRGDGIDRAWLPGDAEAWAGNVSRDAAGRVDVRQLIAAQGWQGEAPLVLVVAEDLRAKGCESLFGFADPRARVAVVSAFRLSGEGEPMLRERLAKVIAHEWMHLGGKRHCREQGCLMHAVASVAELDTRGEALCPRCRRAAPGWRRWPWQGIAATVAALALLSFGLDATVAVLRTHERPFFMRTTATGAAVFYQGEEVLRFPARASSQGPSAEDARKLEAELNRLFAEIDPPRLVVRRVGNTVAIDAGGAPVLTVDARIAGTSDPEAFARDWVAKWDPLLQAKGRPHESCPDCHIRRRAQVREAVARPPRFWR